MADQNLSDQLRSFLDIQEATNRTTTDIRDQRKLMDEVAKVAKKASIPFNKISGDIGQSVKNLHLFESIERQLNQLTTDKITLENDLVNKIQEQIRIKKALSKLQELESDPIKASLSLIKEQSDKIDEINKRRLFGETISRAQEQEELNAIEEKYNNLSSFIDLHKKIAKENEKSIKYTQLVLKHDQSRIDKLTAYNKLGSVSKEILGQMGDLGRHISELKFPDWTDVIRKGVLNFLEYDKAAFGLRKQFGLMRGDNVALQTNVKTLGIDLMSLGATFEQIVASANAIGNDFNSFVASNKSIVSDVTLMATQLGIAETDSSKFLKTISSIANTTAISQKGMFGFVKQMSNAAGIPLPAIMKDISETTDDIRIFIGKSVDNLVKGVVQARQMGTTLQRVAETSKKLLDFQTSISDEMEASVLLGKDINLQNARNLAYRKDIVGATQEILNITKKVDFDNMDPYQAEAFAKATGKSVHELQEMLQADKEIEWVRKNGTVEQKLQLSQLEKLKSARLNEMRDIGKSAELRLKQEANQERINILQNQFNQLMSELSRPVMDFVEPLLNVAVKILPTITKGLLALTPVFGVFKFFSYFDKIVPFVKALGSFGKTIVSIAGFVGKIASPIGKIFGTVLKFTGVFGNFLGPIGLVINAFQFLNSLMKRWEDTPKGFLGGLKAIGGALYDTLIQPFVDAFNWIKEKSGFMANSPSKVGLGILDGIKSIGGLLLDALLMPFSTSFNLISGMFTASKIQKLVEMPNLGSIKDTAVMSNKADIGMIITESNNKLIDKMDQLINLMANGGISVNIDGTKASALIARAQKERGVFGSI